MKFKYALFDLDGTLSESGPGITKCVQYALSCLGIDEPDINNLMSFVGPPLNLEFKRRYGLNPAQIVIAVEKYRERYGDKGLYECTMYPGIPQMLKECSDRGIILAVASSKPEPYVRRIIDYFGITDCFAVIVGSEMDEEKDKAGADQKQFIVRRALEELRAAGIKEGQTGEEISTAKAPADPLIDEDFRSHCAMVGDRCFDMDGARANKVSAVGVTFGYGTEEELKEAGADYIAHDAAELTKILCQ